MNVIQEKLRPFIDLLPETLRDYWWAIFGLAALFLVLIALALLRGLFRVAFGKRKTPKEDWTRNCART